MTRLTRLSGLALAAGLSASGAALAHEGHAHQLAGRVVAFHADAKTLEVETAGGATVTVAVGDATKYLKRGETASTADLKQGTRVVVTYKEEGGTKTATIVRMSPKRKPRAAPSPAVSPAPAASPAPTPSPSPNAPRAPSTPRR